jgi:hypothetical protein
MKSKVTILDILIKKTAAFLFITVMALAAFASLGDGKSKGKKASLLNNNSSFIPGKFSLRSGYQYRGSQVINQQKTNNVLNLNSTVTFQRGNMTFILPIKTTVNTQKIKISAGVPQLNKY